ncbi:uncharacterized protein K452DRAFT_100205 [Aplosporella prunicola CBS 121167]|uniref:Uncharacterized protein n=1 Tax=Aplosporella prunicola CBS 121167 TaxID=1176127 RepID=A0A6A6B0D2_9PEZI|nr:uncharacterized protein K452DRAFT_100205 [Aplosporella prunicola CBS 121167]KAF2137639.1 hypothetical protein K452DRAFT_100205 [Aplosporella prunicola CBS 121167]
MGMACESRLTHARERARRPRALGRLRAGLGSSARDISGCCWVHMLLCSHLSLSLFFPGFRFCGHAYIPAYLSCFVELLGFCCSSSFLKKEGIRLDSIRHDTYQSR